MAKAYIMDFDGGSAAQYDAVIRDMDLGGHVPPGAVFHYAGPFGDGWRGRGHVVGARGVRPLRTRAHFVPLAGAQGLPAPRLTALDVVMQHTGALRRPEIVQVVRLPGLDEAAFRAHHEAIVGGRYPDDIVHHVNGPYDGGWFVIDSLGDAGGPRRVHGVPRDAGDGRRGPRRRARRRGPRRPRRAARAGTGGRLRASGPGPGARAAARDPNGGPVPGWTRTNFGDVPDRSPADVPIQWRFTREELGSEELGVSRFTYEPGARMPFGHRHREQEEVYVVVAGAGRAKLDDEVIELGRWDALRVAPSVVRSFEAGVEGMDLICIGTRRPPGGDNEGFPDFWR